MRASRTPAAQAQREERRRIFPFAAQAQREEGRWIFFLAAITLVILLATGLAGPRLSLARTARALQPGGYIFAGMDDGHIFRSADGGATWQEADTGIPVGEGVSGLAVAPDSSTTVYAATWGAGLFVSTDGGDHWQDDNGNGGPARERLVAVAVDPHDSRHLVTLSQDAAFTQSHDGGRSWSSQVLSGGGHGFTSVALTVRRPPSIFAGSNGGGLHVSTDGGTTWHQADGIPGDYTVNINDLAVDPHVPDSGYASTGVGLYRTRDGGQTWHPVPGALSAAPIDAVRADPRGSAGVFVATTDGLIYGSGDSGDTWQQVSTQRLGELVAFAFDPAAAGRIVAVGRSTSLLRSADSGASWQRSDPGFDASRVLCLASSAPIPLPTDPVAAPSNLRHVRYFPATGHTLRDPFLSFWDRHGNGPLFGSPLTEPFVEGGHLVQYFERVRLSSSGGRIGVDPLGEIYTAGRHFSPVAQTTSSASRLYFPSTGHSLAAPFLAYWLKYGGSRIIGPPISEQRYEQNGDGSGRSYVLQYFRNMRLEYHPELANSPYLITPGLIGRQYLHQRGWI